MGNDLKAELERVLAEAASSPAALGEAFMQLNRLLAYEPDKQATLRLVESVAQPYPDLAGGALRRCARRATTQGSPSFRRRRLALRKSIVR